MPKISILLYIMYFRNIIQNILYNVLQNTHGLNVQNE